MKEYLTAQEVATIANISMYEFRELERSGKVLRSDNHYPTSIILQLKSMGYLISLPSELKEILSKPKHTLSGTIWVNNGIEERRMPQEDAQEFLSNGWVRGRIPKNS